MPSSRPASAALTAPPAQEAWDFDGCPDNRIEFCFAYEYAREVPAILDEFRNDLKEHPSAFDKYGTWHFLVLIEDIDHSFPVTEVIDAPKGFPDEAYLAVKHVITPNATFPFGAKGQSLRPVTIKGEHFQDSWGNLFQPEHVSSFHILWRENNKTILKDFATWLKNVNRPLPPKEKRGKSPLKIYRADLRALGMWRLLKHFKSPKKAMAYLRQIGAEQKGHANEPDWFKARNRAQSIIDLWSQIRGS